MRKREKRKRKKKRRKWRKRKNKEKKEVEKEEEEEGELEKNKEEAFPEHAAECRSQKKQFPGRPFHYFRALINIRRSANFM